MQLAHSYSLPCHVPCVADPGYMLGGHMGRHSIITALDGQPMATLDDVCDFFAATKDGDEVVCTFHEIDSPMVPKQCCVPFSRSWFGVYRRECQGIAGKWSRIDIPDPGLEKQDPPSSPQTRQISSHQQGSNNAERTLAPSLVTVDCARPFAINGIRGTRCELPRVTQHRKAAALTARLADVLDALQIGARG
jgi:hypothetical protein